MVQLSIEALTGIFIFTYVALAFSIPGLRKRFKGLNKWLESRENFLSNHAKWWIMAILAIGSIYLNLNCWFCGTPQPNAVDKDAIFFEWILINLQMILPWFILGCIIAGYVMKLMSTGKLKLPKSMIGSGTFAAILPLCSCAAVPMAHGMMLGRQMRLRAIIAFLIIVPVLSPVVFSLAISQIGWEYLAIEIISIFSLAMISGIIIERLAGRRAAKSPGKQCYTCQGCKSSHIERKRSSAMLASWDQLNYLLKYILLGIIISAWLSTFIQSGDLINIFGTADTGLMQSILGLVLIVLIAIPLFICSGEDIIILVPLLAMGLPLGHAIAFSIAGNAICITAIPVLRATFGKKVTVLILATFFFGAIALGLIINSFVWALS